ncbi:DUF4136 domain-containing protein [Photobacterium gaetbulicola]|uniref:DUF4136 domain-containing protein n=1 Tax=Photobacterium gaetbulicola Gung47 TaxID=658445 RepID=A0A0C5WII5_9GAMM|nr:DUF4136 domain-containing protein [Photobacterium gaetbulicola]AJR05977.1 hypothetical protein H744_1c0952 [Photobacterium gaetbulicola Gung47]PSU13216.1 DUF4136 domain-containing protein [Photobacterium gaetbulicola]
MAKPLIFLIVALISACTKDVVTDYSTAVDYSNYRTYEFAAFSTTQATTLDGKRVEEAIAIQLHTKGLTAVNENGDLLVRHSIIEQSDFKSYGTSVGLGYGRRNFGVAYSSPVHIQEYQYGKIVVELIDNQSNIVVWRSTSQRKLTENMTPSSRRTFINTQINEMFKEYPPKK